MRSITLCGEWLSNSRAVGAGEPEHVAGEVDRHHVQAEAQAQARDVVLTGVAGGGDLALDAPRPEPAGDDDAVEVAEAALGQQALDLLGLDPLDLDLGPVVEAAVLAAPRRPTGRRRGG